jgi:hypothetical protein
MRPQKLPTAETAATEKLNDTIASNVSDASNVGDNIRSDTMSSNKIANDKTVAIGSDKNDVIDVEVIDVDNNEIVANLSAKRVVRVLVDDDQVSGL